MSPGNQVFYLLISYGSTANFATEALGMPIPAHALKISFHTNLFIATSTHSKQKTKNLYHIQISLVYKK